MLRSVVDFKSLEQKQDGSWERKIPKDVPHILNLERHIPPKTYKSSHLHIWTQFTCRVWGHIQGQQDQIPLTSIDLTSQSDAESQYSVSTLGNCSSITSVASSATPASLVFNIILGDERFIKAVDFATFARWENVRTLLNGFEDEGGIIDELWDVRERMPIWSGDWEARVYPGMEVDVTCRRPWDGHMHRSSDDTKDEALEELLWQTEKPRVRHWWFGSWRMKVEQETMRVGAGAGQEPSRRKVLLGSIAVAAFLGIVIVFCAL